MPDLITHDTLIFASACVIAALGGLLPGIRFPSGKEWRNLRVACGYLALGCLILAALSVLNLLMQGYLIHDYTENRSVEDVLVLLIASYQALLFTMMLLTFIQPLYVRKERVVPQAAVITVAGGVLFLSLYLWEPAFPFVLYTAMAAYLCQLVYYTILFRKKYTLCLRQMEEYYDEDEDHRLQWVRSGFYIALAIGVMALCTFFANRWVYDAFIVIYTAFYVYMVCRFLNYKNNEVMFVLPAVIRETGVTKKENRQSRETRNRQYMTEREQKFKVALEEWMKEKKFSEKDIGVEEIAHSLGTDSSFLRYYFRTYMENDFRTWRSELRIREAQQILDQNPYAALSQVCERVGFNDKGNFHRQFQKITGTTPAHYKQDCRDKIDTRARFHRSLAAGFTARDRPVPVQEGNSPAKGISNIGIKSKNM